VEADVATILEAETETVVNRPRPLLRPRRHLCGGPEESGQRSGGRSNDECPERLIFLPEGFVSQQTIRPTRSLSFARSPVWSGPNITEKLPNTGTEKLRAGSFAHHPVQLDQPAACQDLTQQFSWSLR
jgi:hypothetical protein